MNARESRWSHQQSEMLPIMRGPFGCRGEGYGCLQWGRGIIQTCLKKKIQQLLGRAVAQYTPPT